MNNELRIGFVASRLAGTDGVSLEAQKWYEVFQGMNCQCFCFCGRTDWPSDRAYLSETASFMHDDIARINRQLFKEKHRTSELGCLVTRLKEDLKGQLREFIARYDINLLIAENVLSLPMNLPLGLATAEYIAESQIPTIGHHHDFWWERSRYTGSPAEDYLRAAFPPTMSAIRHVVINSVAARELAFRTGGRSTLIPNMMDFANPPQPPDSYADDLRQAVGLKTGEHLILQPTRIVPRKRIERAIELVCRLKADCALLVTHDAGDEGYDYVEYLNELADIMNVRLLMPTERFDKSRGRTEAGDKIYAISDAYHHAALVTYCSMIEGFGNAFLEAIYYQRPLLMSAYEIFSLDIYPKGFKVRSFQEFIPHDLVRQVERLLQDPEAAAAEAAYNYELAQKHFSFEALEAHLHHITQQCMGRD